MTSVCWYSFNSDNQDDLQVAYFTILQVALPHKLWQNIQLSEYNYQTLSLQVYCRYAIKAGLELFINASLVGYPYILMRWF